MAENTGSGAQVGNLDTVEQQLEAVRLMLEHAKKSEEIKRLNGLLNDRGDQLTREQIQAIGNEIATCKDSLKETMDKVQREFGVRDLVQLDAALEKREINFVDPKYGVLCANPRNF